MMSHVRRVEGKTPLRRERTNERTNLLDESESRAMPFRRSFVGDRIVRYTFARTAQRAIIMRLTAVAMSALCALALPRHTTAFSRSSSAVTTAVRHLSSSSITGLFSLKEEVDPGVVEGTDLRVLKYPNPSLRAENAECTEEELKDGTIAKIAKEMFLVMYAAEGVGLAAPQVGINKKLMVYNESGDKKKWLDEIVMVNPKIVEFSEAKDVEIEGCLSFPKMNGKVERSKWIKVEAQNLKGKKIKKKFKGWEARIFQHEYDHLDGVVYIDRLDEEDRSEVQPVLDELVEEFGEGGVE